MLLSDDRGPNAGEIVLHALAGRLTGALVYHAAARGIAVKGISTSLEGDVDLQGFLGLSKTIRNGFSRVRVAFDGDWRLRRRALTGAGGPGAKLFARVRHVVERPAGDLRARQPMRPGCGWKPETDVMAGLVPAIHVLFDALQRRRGSPAHRRAKHAVLWMAMAGHDEKKGRIT